MKSVLIFIGGVATGVVLTILGFVIFSVIVASHSTSVKDENGMQLFEQPGNVVNEKSFEVFQAIEQGAALVHGGNDHITIYMLMDDEGNYYYDHEIITVPAGKVVRQIGVFNYSTRGGLERTVQVVKIMNK